MKKLAKTFRIECPVTVPGRKLLMESMCSVLKFIGYNLDLFESKLDSFENSKFAIVPNLYLVDESDSFEDYRTLLATEDPHLKNDKLFVLPQDWNDAISFAKAQLDPILWTKSFLKVDDIVIVLAESNVDKGKIGKITKIFSDDKNVYATLDLSDYHGDFLSFNINDLAIANTQQVELYNYRHLLIDLKEKYPIGCLVKTLNYPSYYVTIQNHILSNNELNTVSFDDHTIYKDGIFAEKVEEILSIKGPVIFLKKGIIINGSLYSPEEIATILWRIKDGILLSQYESEFIKIINLLKKE